MNTSAKEMMEKWSKLAEKNYNLAEKYRVISDESKDLSYQQMYLEYLYKGQLCGKAALDFESLL